VGLDAKHTGLVILDELGQQTTGVEFAAA